MIDIENDLENILKLGKEPKEYIKDYLDLVDQCKSRGLNKDLIDFYTEIHHVLPKSLGGSDDYENLVALSFNEHLIAHLLLFLACKENKHLVLAASMMLFGRDVPSEILPTIKNYEKLNNMLKTRFSNVFKIKIVCFDLKSYNVAKIYDSLTAAEKDGFSMSKISSVIHKKRKSSGGYGWETLDVFSKEHQKELRFFTENIIEEGSEVFLSPIKKERLVCFCEGGNIQKVYSSPMSAENIDGFDSRQISAVLVEKQITSRGYYWLRENKFNELYPDRLDDFLNSHKVDDDTPIEVKKLEYRGVVCLDDNKNIVTIYEYSSKIDLDVERFNTNTISKSIKTIIMAGKKRAGYYWMYLDDYAKQYPEKLKEYYERNEHR